MTLHLKKPGFLQFSENYLPSLVENCLVRQHIFAFPLLCMMYEFRSLQTQAIQASGNSFTAKYAATSVNVTSPQG